MKCNRLSLALGAALLCALPRCAADSGSANETDAAIDAGPDANTGEALPLLLVDVDMGLDDARVVVSLPMQGVFEVAGIVTVEGTAGAAKGADNALRLLAVLGVDSVPVAVGSTTTFTGEAVPAPSWREMAESLGGLALDPSERPVEAEDGVTFERRVLRESASKVNVLAIGLTTNLALALSEEPELADKIEAVYLLGDFSACSGYNCTTDPEAGAAVLASGVPVYMLMPAETDQMPFDAAFLAEVQALDGPAAQLVAGFMATHADGYMKLWDDGVLASMLDAGVVTYSAFSGTVNASTAVDVGGVEALLLILWDTPAPVTPGGDA